MTNWITHFRKRTQVKKELMTQVYELTSAETKRIAGSIAEFERGESSEALDFRIKNAEFAAAKNRPDFEEAAHLFIAEENRHAHLLANYMEQHGISTTDSSAADAIFRWLRSRTEVAWSSRVLITAEVIAQVYYPALKEATRDPQLKAICDRIIEDEAYHIAFQTERIYEVESTLGSFRCLIHRFLHPFLFAGTAMVVWYQHHPVLSHSLSFTRYVAQCRMYFRYAIACIGMPKVAETPHETVNAPEELLGCS